jgi:hypothetical protein
MVNRVLEITFTLIMVFLVLSNAGNFSTVTGAISNAYVQSVRALQGR